LPVLKFGRQAHPVIAHYNLQLGPLSHPKADKEHADASVGEGILKRVGNQLVDNKAAWHCLVDIKFGIGNIGLQRNIVDDLVI
jgi:hypothetical protein